MRKRIVLMMWLAGLCSTGAVAETEGSLRNELYFVASNLETSIGAKPPDPSNQTTANFEFSSSVANTSFECAFDTESPFGCISPLRRRNLTEGPHKFCVAAVDGSGQKDASPACYSWTVDLTPPEVTISEPASGTGVFTSDPIIKGTTNEPSSTVNLIVNGNSVGSIVSEADGKWTFNKPLGLTDGSHTVRATATDAAGNTSVRPAEITFKVSAVEPDTSIVEHPQQVHSSRHSVFEFGSPTGATRFECQLDNAAAGFTDCDQVALFKNLSDGSHTLKVRAKDSAGNVDPTPVEFTWKVDTQSPPGTCSPGDSGGDQQGGCASSGGQPTLVLSLLGGLLLVLTARRRRSS